MLNFAKYALQFFPSDHGQLKRRFSATGRSRETLVGARAELPMGLSLRMRPNRKTVKVAKVPKMARRWHWVLGQRDNRMDIFDAAGVRVAKMFAAVRQRRLSSRQGLLTPSRNRRCPPGLGTNCNDMRLQSRSSRLDGATHNQRGTAPVSKLLV